MAMLKKVTGTWKGTYGYDLLEQTAKLEPVTFTLAVKQGWFGRFSGTVTEDGPHGMPGIGVVAGYFYFPRIEFTKRMPVCCVGMPDGRIVTLQEFLKSQGQPCDRDVSHMPIFYEGQFSSASRAEGTWVIRAGLVSLGDGRSLQMPEARGR